MGIDTINKVALAGEEIGQDVTPGSDRGPGSASQDRRLTANLHLYWYSLKVDREPPTFVKFDPTSIPTLWPHCILAAREGPSGVFSLADLGPALANDITAPVRGLAVDAVSASTLVGQALGCLTGAFNSRKAAPLESRFRHQNGTEMIYRAIGLPFLDVRRRLTYVVCAIGGKAI